MWRILLEANTGVQHSEALLWFATLVHCVDLNAGMTARDPTSNNASFLRSQYGHVGGVANLMMSDY